MQKEPASYNSARILQELLFGSVDFVEDPIGVWEAVHNQQSIPLMN